jgi:hypothetical protein
VLLRSCCPACPTSRIRSVPDNFKGLLRAFNDQEVKYLVGGSYVLHTICVYSSKKS